MNRKLPVTKEPMLIIWILSTKHMNLPLTSTSTISKSHNPNEESPQINHMAISSNLITKRSYQWLPLRLYFVSYVGWLGIFLWIKVDSKSCTQEQIQRRVGYLKIICSKTFCYNIIQGMSKSNRSGLGNLNIV